MNITQAPDVQVAQIKSQIDDAQASLDKALRTNNDTTKYRRRLASLELELAEAEQRVAEAEAEHAARAEKLAADATAALSTEIAAELNEKFERHGAAYRVHPTDERLTGVAAVIVNARIQMSSAVEVETRMREEVVVIEQLIAAKVKRSNELEEARIAGQETGAAELYALSRDIARLREFLTKAEERESAASSAGAVANRDQKEADLKRVKSDILKAALQENVNLRMREFIEALRTLKETADPGSTLKSSVSVLNVWKAPEQLEKLVKLGHLTH